MEKMIAFRRDVIAHRALFTGGWRKDAEEIFVIFFRRVLATMNWCLMTDSS